MDRMHYRGPFWEGKPKPRSVLDESNPLQMGFADDEKPQAEVHPSMSEEKEERWEKVKR